MAIQFSKIIQKIEKENLNLSLLDKVFVRLHEDYAKDFIKVLDKLKVHYTKDDLEFFIRNFGDGAMASYEHNQTEFDWEVTNLNLIIWVNVKIDVIFILAIIAKEIYGNKMKFYFSYVMNPVWRVKINSCLNENKNYINLSEPYDVDDILCLKVEEFNIHNISKFFPCYRLVRTFNSYQEVELYEEEEYNKEVYREYRLEQRRLYQEQQDFNPYWMCNVCDGDQDTGCLLSDPQNCLR